MLMSDKMEHLLKLAELCQVDSLHQADNEGHHETIQEVEDF